MIVTDGKLSKQLLGNFGRATSLGVTDFFVVAGHWWAQPTLRSWQFVAELVALGGEVAGVVGVGRGDDGNLVDDLEVEAIVDEGVHLFWVVGEQPNLAQAEV